MNRRLIKDVQNALLINTPGVTVRLEDEDIHKVHVLFRYPQCILDKSPYQYGAYWMMVDMPNEYPDKRPSVRFMTPNGRFTPGGNICMSGTTFHTDLAHNNVDLATYINSWFVFLQMDDMGAIGYERTNDETKLRLAYESHKWNAKQPRFCKIFQGVDYSDEERRATNKRPREEPVVQVDALKRARMTEKRKRLEQHRGHIAEDTPEEVLDLLLSELPGGAPVINVPAPRPIQAAPAPVPVPAPVVLTAEMARNWVNAKFAQDDPPSLLKFYHKLHLKNIVILKPLSEILKEIVTPIQEQQHALSTPLASTSDMHMNPLLSTEGAVLYARKEENVDVGQDTSYIKVSDRNTKLMTEAQKYLELLSTANGMHQSEFVSKLMPALNRLVSGGIQSPAELAKSIERQTLSNLLTLYIPPPETQQTTPAPFVLLPHQVDVWERILRCDRGIRNIIPHGGGLLCDAPGVGKTHLMTALVAVDPPNSKMTLIVCRETLQAQWYKTFASMGVDSSRIRFRTIINKKTRLHEFKRIIIDEAHEARLNFEVERTDNFPSIWFVTGTPDEGTIEKLQQIIGNRSTVSRLRMFSEVGIRRTQQAVKLRLPDIYLRLHEVEMSPELHEQYKLNILSLRNHANACVLLNNRPWEQVRDEVIDIQFGLTMGKMRNTMTDLTNKDQRDVFDVINFNKVLRHDPVPDWIAFLQASPSCLRCAIPMLEPSSWLPNNDFVFFRQCHHTMCKECFMKEYMKAHGQPSCGLPCRRQPLNDCVFVSKINPAWCPWATPMEVEEYIPPEYVDGKMAKIQEIVNLCNEIKEPMALASSNINVIAHLKKTYPDALSIEPHTNADYAIEQLRAGKTNMLILHIPTASVGLNLQGIRQVVVCEPFLNDVDFRQFAKRFSRVGATGDVLMHFVITKNTFEKSLYNFERHLTAEEILAITQ